MKKAPLNKKSKQTITQIQDKLWEECKRIIRARYPHVCYTCGKPVEGSNAHTAHFIPKASLGAYLKYDLRLLRICCYHCNINLGGNLSVFYRNMVECEGQKYVDDIFNDRNISVKAMDHYTQLLITYKDIEK